MTKATETKATKEELIAKIAELEKNLVAEKSKSTNMKTRVRNLLDAGVNSIDAIATELEVTNKNVSSVLTSLRKEMKAEGWTIITQQFNEKSMIAILDTKALGWTE